MSSVLDISLIYSMKMPTLISPSISAIRVSEPIKRLIKPAIASGSHINTTKAIITENIIDAVITTLSALSPKVLSSHNSNLPGSSPSSSS